MIEMISALRTSLALSLVSLTTLSGCSLLGIGSGAAADPRAITARPTGFVYSTLFAKNKVLEIDNVQSRVSNDPIDVPNGPRGLAMDPRDRNLFLYVVCELGNTVAVVDRRNRLVNRTINVGNAPYAMAITPNGTRGFVTNTNDDSVSVIDIATNTVVQTILLQATVTNTGTAPVQGNTTVTQQRPLRPRGIATNATGTAVYVACAGGALAILTGTPPTTSAGASQTGVGSGNTAGGSAYSATVIPLPGSGSPLHVAVANPGTSSGSGSTGTGTTTGVTNDLVYITNPNVGVFFKNGQAQPVLTGVQGTPYDVAVGKNPTTGNPDMVYVSLESRNALLPFRAADFSAAGEGLSVTGSQPQFVAVSSLGTEVYTSLAGSNNIAVFGRSTGTQLTAPQVFNLQQLNPAFIAPTGDIALGGFLTQ